MPLYEYQCEACGHRFEVIQKFSDAPPAACPKCGGAVEKLVSSPAIQFKGSGFYLTDYGRGGKSDTAPGQGRQVRVRARRPTKGGQVRRSATRATRRDKSRASRRTSERRQERVDRRRAASPAAGQRGEQQAGGAGQPKSDS